MLLMQVEPHLIDTGVLKRRQPELSQRLSSAPDRPYRNLRWHSEAISRSLPPHLFRITISGSSVLPFPNTPVGFISLFIRVVDHKASCQALGGSELLR